MITQTTRLGMALGALKDHYPQEIELSLGRIERLLARLGNPHLNLPPLIHVAGTNGKGSTCAFLRAMVEAAGLRAHVFTSPHLVRFNERVRLAGTLISDDAFADTLERVAAALGDDQITHFEATTAAAFIAFSETPADLLILEVGLGGRFDATNVVADPVVCVISPVDYDHKQFLGDTLEEIAGEKAGIIKPGVPVISAIQAPVAARVLAAEAERKNAPLSVLDAVADADLPATLALPGAHQRANAALAGAALACWGHSAITREAIQRGAQTAQWPARMQRLSGGPLTDSVPGKAVWLDGGHNPHAARAVAALLADMPGKTALVAAMMASKDARGFFAEFAALNPRVHTCPNSEGHQGAAPVDLAAAAGQAGLTADAHGNFDAAFAAAARSDAARILICGSLFLAGDVLAANNEAPD